MIRNLNFFGREDSFHSFQANDSVFMKWLREFETEQTVRGILTGTIINRQVLHHLWENNYTPVEALKELAGVDANYQR